VTPIRALLAFLLSQLCLSTVALGQSEVDALEYPASDWEELVGWDMDWTFWADLEAPPRWPLTEMPESRDALELLSGDGHAHEDRGTDLQCSPRDRSDRVLVLREEDQGLATAGSWWSGFLAPFSGWSEQRWQLHYPKWKKSRDRQLRKHKRYFSRTQLIFPAGSESTEDLLIDEEAPEEGLTNLYFVRSFTVDDPSRYTSLQVQARFNKGLQVYINGKLVVRQRLDPDQTGHGAYGIDPEYPDFIWMHIGANDRWQYNWDAIPPDILREGENIISAVVHKPETGESPSMYFDLLLRGWTDIGWVKLPYLHGVTRSGVTISWQTTVPTLGSVDIIGESNQVLSSFGSSSTGPHHEVLIHGLEPDTSYRYRVHAEPTEPEPAADGSIPSVLSSEALEFTTAPTHDSSFSFLFYGDSRMGVEIHRPLAEMMLADHEEHGSNVVLHAGDLVTTGYTWDLWQDRFFAPAHPLISRVPIYPSVGNHEVNQKLYYDYFDLPNNESWYHFRYGIADFYALNTNVDYGPESKQYAWFEQALAASTAPWKIAFFHHPPYACATGRKPGDKQVQEHLVPLLEKYGVDLVLLGHDHVYGRSRKVQGVTYVISGGGGSPLYNTSTDGIMVVCEKRYNYVRFQVSEQSISWVAIDEKGETIEEYEISD
jgi:predicted phosphodiesterase